MLLDTGPLGLVTHPNAAIENKQATQWLQGLLQTEVAVLIPEIADYELRRELLRAGKAKSVMVLDRYKARLGYVPLTTEAMLQAAQFWAKASPFDPTRKEARVDLIQYGLRGHAARGVCKDVEDGFLDGAR